MQIICFSSLVEEKGKKLKNDTLIIYKKHPDEIASED
jgi:hypothetical protein